MKDSSFKEYVLDQLADMSDIHAKSMFGGFGLYCGEIFFAIISDGVLYCKTNQETKEKYIEAGMDCFKPSEKQVLKQYYEVPAAVIDDREELLMWVEEALDVSENS